MPGPTEREKWNSRKGKGGAVMDAIAIHGQDTDYKLQDRKPTPKPAEHRPYCAEHHTYWCPCVRPHLYSAPFMRPGDPSFTEALDAWNESVKQ